MEMLSTSILDFGDVGAAAKGRIELHTSRGGMQMIVVTSCNLFFVFDVWLGRPHANELTSFWFGWEQLRLVWLVSVLRLFHSTTS